jgi:hypothetical protein
MKKISLTLVIFITVCNCSLAQKNTLNNVLKIKAKDFSPILFEGEVKGYSAFYELDKIDKSKKSYRISFFDNSLKVSSSTDFIESKNIRYVSSTFNGKSIMVLFYDEVKKLVIFRKFNLKGEEISKKIKKIGSDWEATLLFQDTPNIKAIKNKGYVYYGSTSYNKYAYSIHYYPEDESKKEWTIAYPPKTKGLAGASLLSEMNDILINAVQKRKKLLSTKGTQNFIQAIDIKTGKILFEVITETEKYKFAVSEGVINQTTGNIELYGTYFNLADELTKAKSLGIASIIYNQKGELISEKYNSWIIDIASLLPSDKKEEIEQGSRILLHKVIKDTEGNIIIVGEQYKITLGSSGSKVIVEDMITMQLNEKFELKKVNIFEKEKSHTSVPNLIRGEFIIGGYAKSIGAFDYCFSQINKKTSDITILYKDFYKNEQILGVISHVNGYFSETKTRSKFNTKKFWIFMAKPGYVLIYEESKENKKVDLRIEKLN